MQEAVFDMDDIHACASHQRRHDRVVGICLDEVSLVHDHGHKEGYLPLAVYRDGEQHRIA